MRKTARIALPPQRRGKHLAASLHHHLPSGQVSVASLSLATVLYDMNDETQFGKQLHVITFSEAVQLKLLTDYKVIVLTIDEAHVSARIQELLKDESNQLNVDDAARIIGCWKALSKQGLTEDLSTDPEPMRRAVAFCQVIERSSGRTRKVSSKQISEMFGKVVAAYQQQENSEDTLICEAAHVDGSMNASQKEEKLNWLKADSPDNTCRILSNVRCLSEGVDVPALDAVLFLTPRNSQVDVVQSVGRVMRNAPGKKRGYVILPVVIPVGMEPHDALNDNKVYKVVWQVLQALRSHDDTFDAMINKIDLTGHDTRKMEVISITDKAQKKSTSSKDSGQASGKGQNTIGSPETRHPAEVQTDLQFQVGELERALYAKVVKKCGNPNHWEEWAADIAKIAKTHISRITQIVGDPSNTKEVLAFKSFADELRDDLNDSITDAEVIEMLAQHLITKPVFDALFEDYSSASHNPVSQAMQHVLEVLHEHHLEKDAETLEKFYASVKLRAARIDDVTAKQKIVVELYDKFFRNAFPKMTERLGIVYTPVEVVDFILHSINDLLQSEFGQTLGSKGVHIIDPFTGTGTFITRLLQSGLISKEQLPHKYKHEVHANEIVLLAYYIAAINIEAVYHSIMKDPGATSPALGRPGGAQSSDGTEPRAMPWAGMDQALGLEEASFASPISVANAIHSSAPTGHPIPAQGNALGPNDKKIPSPEGAPHGYEPFQGICLTDTFQLYEKGDLISNLLTNNSDRRKRQKALDIRVIMGNPPYSVGQENANDNNQNVAYPSLDERIAETYAARTDAILKNSLYDSYIRAIRWASDRIGNCGVIGFVTNAGFVDSASGDGLRKCLADEFSKIYVFHLRGNQRTSGELSRKEGGKVFGSGSRAPIAITFLVKNPQAQEHGQILLHDIGDYLTREEKLAKVARLKSVSGLSVADAASHVNSEALWSHITPDVHGDWIKQRDTSFSTFLAIAGRDLPDDARIFRAQSGGIKSNRDVWSFNSSRAELERNIQTTIEFYNKELARITKSGVSAMQGTETQFETNNDSTKISWTRGLRDRLRKGRRLAFVTEAPRTAFYRPFTRVWVYLDSTLIEVMSKIPSFFPKDADNLVIWSTGIGATVPFSCWISNTICSLQQGPAAVQHFPLFIYDGGNSTSTNDGEEQEELFAATNSATTATHTRRDAITDPGLAHFQRAYPAKGEGTSITKEDLFYYIYGLLHSPDYRSRYADNLGKELPRIPAVKTYADFRAFSQAGRDLAHWHPNYETVACHPGVAVFCGKEEGPYCPSSSAAANAEEATVRSPLLTLTAAQFRVTKMKFGKTKDASGKNVNDKSTVIYNEYITLKNIPLAAYDYIVNGKPALEWVMERQSVTTDKDSGIINDANLWATETMGNPKYPLELFLRVVTVGLETMKVVDGLPVLDI